LMVVVPTSEEVTLEFRDTWAETGGLILSVAGIVVLLGVGVAAVRRKRIESSPGSAGSA
jgi:LPXTG-motif cell wall-anchored protein